MAEETSRIENVCLQTKRFKTATVKAKILDTERLNHIGLDMSEWRCKDLAKIKYLHKSTIRNLNSSSDLPYHHQESGQSDSTSNVLTKSSSQGAELSSNKLFGLKYSASVDLPNNNKSTTNGLPCTSCQISGGLIERFQSHAIISNKLSKKINNSKRNNGTEGKPEEANTKQSYLSRIVKFGMGFQRRNKNGSSPSSLTDGNHSNSNSVGYFTTGFDQNNYSKPPITNSVIRTPPSVRKQQEATKPNSSGWLSFIEYHNDGPNVDKVKETEGRSAFRQRLRKCNLCGNEFGTAGFKIHQPRCIQAHLLEENSREETLTSNSNHQVNSHSKNFFEQKRRPTHSNKNKQGDPPITASSTPRSVFRPIICYICKRQFGSQSIAIHQPQCLRKWQLNNDKLPPNCQKPEPSAP